jgi:hypothetical protein
LSELSFAGNEKQLQDAVIDFVHQRKASVCVYLFDLSQFIRRSVLSRSSQLDELSECVCLPVV